MAQAATLELARRLAQLGAESGLANLQVQVLGPEEFPWRPALDYERKFDYLAAAPV